VVSSSDVPSRLREREFKPAENKADYSSSSTEAWKNPGPVKGPFHARLADGSVVTYYWYRFIDQPALQQYKNIWSDSMKGQIQSLVEMIHRKWTPGNDYMPAPRDGRPLVSIDPGLIVTPPEGLDSGYVPIVTSQEMPK